MQVRRRIAHSAVAIIAASAGLTVWSGLASADSADTRKIFTQAEKTGHGPGGCSEGGGGPASASSSL